MQIDAPIQVEKGDFSGAMTQDGDEGGIGGNDDDVIIDSKKLYKNFIDLVANQKLSFIQQSQLKRDGTASGMNMKDDQ